jgi:hypothetical protein
LRSDPPRRVKPAHSIATRIACSWKSGAPIQHLAENLFELGLRILDGPQAFASRRYGLDHVALDGTWPHDRHLDDEIIKLRVKRGSIDICARLSSWTLPSVSASGIMA